MVSINNDASGHACFTDVWYEGGSGCSAGVLKTGYFWRLFNEYEQMVMDALEMVRGAAAGNAQCNARFQGMGTGFSERVNDFETAGASI